MQPDGKAPDVKPLVDGFPLVQEAVPALVLSTIWQIDVVSMLTPPSDPCVRKLDGGLIPDFVVDV